MRRVLLLAIAGAANVSAQALPAYRHRLLGVYDSDGLPLAGIEVVDLRTGTTARTTKTGTVTLAFLPDGGSEVRVRRLGYVPVTQFIKISPEDTTPVTVILMDRYTVLAALVRRDTMGSPGLKDFEARRRTGLGHYISEPELRRMDSRDMANVVRGIPGVTVTCAKVTTQCRAFSTRPQARPGVGAGQCPVTIYVNGIRSTTLDLSLFFAADFAAIEAYSGTTAPAQFRGPGSECGVLVFWSR